jgi:tetratricopeptide (TPR) repeat protein
MSKKVVARKSLNKEEIHNLDIEIGFIEGVLKRDPGFVEALRILGDDYTRRGRFADGLRIDEQLCILRPSDPLSHYNLACSYSLTLQLEQAVVILERAINLGYRDFTWMTRDPDLLNLRKHPLYQRIRDKIKRLRAKKQD